MEKQKREFKIDYTLDWEYGVEISKIRQDLDAIEKLGATNVLIESGMSYDVPYTTIEAISDRIETDSEYEERIQLEEKRQEEIRRRDLEQLEKLKSKYNKT